MTSPLHWPDWWNPSSDWNRFLLGIPLLGPQDACQRELCWQLRQRDDTCLEAWDERRLALARTVSHTIKKHLYWPHDLFVPDDPLEILTWDYTASSIDIHNTGTVVLEIEDRAMVSIDDELWSQALDNWTLGRLVDEILARRA